MAVTQGDPWEALDITFAGLGITLVVAAGLGLALTLLTVQLYAALGRLRSACLVALLGIPSFGLLTLPFVFAAPRAVEDGGD